MLHLVVALNPEARPLVERLRLRRDPEARGFRVFRGDGAALVVSGVGKSAAAAATAYLAAGSPDPGGVWINLGVGGHRERRLGEVVLAHKVRDAATGDCWYPPLAAAPPCATEEVVTVDRPEDDYRRAGLIEMEAAGFYPTACRFATGETVGCLKVVSDNPGSPAGQLTRERVASLIAESLPVVEALASGAMALAAELAGKETPAGELDELRSRFHFTVTEERRLRRLLRRQRVLAPGPLPTELLAGVRRGGELNRRLEAWLDGLPVRLAPAAGDRGATG